MKCPWETPFCSRFGIFLPFTITTIVFFVRPNVFSFVAPKCTTLCSFLAHVSTLVEKVFPRNSVHSIWPLSIIFIFNYWPIETKGCSIQSFFQISGKLCYNLLKLPHNGLQPCFEANDDTLPSQFPTIALCPLMVAG